MMTVLSPVQVLERRRQVLAAQDINAFIELFADDAVMELPFAGPGTAGAAGRPGRDPRLLRAVATLSLRVDDLVDDEPLREPSNPE